MKDSSEAGLLDPEDGDRLRDALELGTRPVGEVMVPLNRMVTVGHGTTPQELERAAAVHGFSRLPVTGPGGTILGYLHIKDALGAADRTKPFPRSTLHPVTKVALDTPLDDTMTAMRAAGTHLAAVTGNKGTVIGFVTMEDVLEELVGPTPAPSPRPDPRPRRPVAGDAPGQPRRSGAAPGPLPGTPRPAPPRSGPLLQACAARPLGPAAQAGAACSLGPAAQARAAPQRPPPSHPRRTPTWARRAGPRRMPTRARRA